MSKQLKISLHADGTIEAQTLGIKGKACLEYLKLIKKLTSAQIIEQKFSEEYWESSVTENQTVDIKNKY